MPFGLNIIPRWLLSQLNEGIHLKEKERYNSDRRWLNWSRLYLQPYSTKKCFFKKRVASCVVTISSLTHWYWKSHWLGHHLRQQQHSLRPLILILGLDSFLVANLPLLGAAVDGDEQMSSATANALSVSSSLYFVLFVLSLSVGEVCFPRWNHTHTPTVISGRRSSCAIVILVITLTNGIVLSSGVAGRYRLFAVYRLTTSTDHLIAPLSSFFSNDTSTHIAIFCLLYLIIAPFFLMWTNLKRLSWMPWYLFRRTTFVCLFVCD